MPQIHNWTIHGKCVGGGVGLAAATDYAIAAEGAEIKLSELSNGIGPFVVGPAVKRKIGFLALHNWQLTPACGETQIGPGEKDYMQNYIPLS